MNIATNSLRAVRDNVEDAVDAWGAATRYWEVALRRWTVNSQNAFVPMHDQSERRTRQSDHAGQRRDCDHWRHRAAMDEREDKAGRVHWDREGREGSRGCCHDECRCCVPGADIVLHTRVGETRVIPFRLRNTWRRVREVTPGVGEWQLCEGAEVDVHAALDAPDTLTLEPCSAKVVRLIVAVQGVPNTKAGRIDEVDDPNREPVNDVETCTSVYADVRFEGCSRPQRVGVVIHSAACVAIELDCHCGCC